MKKFYLLSLLTLLLISCQVTVPLSADYWTKPSKVGVLVNVNPAAKFREGSQGLLDMALTSGDKYQPVLAHIHKNMNPQQDMISMYSEILKSKGKEVIVIAESFDAKKATKFNKPENAGEKKYYDYDFRELKSKYGIDELLLVDVYYGIMVSYYSMFETGRSAHSAFNTKLINLNDNSLLLSNYNPQITPIKGKWDVPPVYDNVTNNMKTTLENSYAVEKTVVK